MTVNVRYLSLWMAYGVLILTTLLSVMSINNRLQAIEQDVCQALLVNLGAEALNPDLDTEGRTTIELFIETLAEECG